MEAELDRAAALMAEGVKATNAAEYANAAKCFEEALAIRRGVLGNAHPDVATVLHNLGTIADDMGDYAAARDYHVQALAIRREVLGEEHPDVAVSLHEIGVECSELGEYGAALGYCEQALAIRRNAFGEVHLAVARTLGTLGNISARSGDHALARKHYEQSLAMVQQLLGEAHPEAAKNLNNLGVIASWGGDYAAARDYYNRALAIRRQAASGPDLDVVRTLSNLGNVFARLGDFLAARPLYEEALVLQRRLLGEDHPDIAENLNNLGNISVELADLPAARSNHERALAIYQRALGETHPNVARSLSNLGAVYIKLDDREAARVRYERSLAIGQQALGENHPGLCEALLGLAELERAKREFARASGYLERAFRIALMPDNVVHLPLAYHQLSLLKRAEGAVDAAIFFGKQAVNAIQRHRARLTDLAPELQRSFVGAKEDIYRELSDLLVEAGRLGEAQQVLAMLKEGELFDLLRGQAGNDLRLTLAQLTNLETEWQRHGDALGQDLVRLSEEAATLRRVSERTLEQRARLDEVRVALDVAGRNFRTWLDGLRDELVAGGDTRTAESRHSAALNLDLLERLQSELRPLGPDVALVSYVLGESKLSIVLTTGSFQLSRDAEISEQTINRLVHEFRLAIDQQLDDDMRRIGQALWKHLMAPIVPQLEEVGVRTLMIVPYGTLRYLPFAAFHDGSRYLIERFAPCVLTLAAHAVFQSQRTADWRVAGLGVSREVPGYRRLQSVAAELRGIVRTTPDQTGVYPGTIHLDEAFTERSFADALETHQVVHLASHFVLNPARGFNSHLLLGDGSPLNLERLRDVSFDFHGVDLMTLSACETAMGSGAEDGREFEGFAALVQRRGAKAVIASLWPVADESTAPLMTAFYRARLNGLTKAAALRIAQLSLLRGAYAHPYHWAPFVLLGNWL